MFTFRFALTVVGRERRPCLPGGGHRGRVGERPHVVDRRRDRRRHRAEHERGHDPELPAAGAAQRPEQVRFAALVAFDDAPVGQHHPRGPQRVAGQPVPAPEDPEPAAEHEAGDPDRRPAAGRDRHAGRVERVVQPLQPRAGPDRRHRSRQRHVRQRRHVDHDPVGGGPAGEAVAAAARHRVQVVPARERERLLHVGL
jgi:hypothetical protein